MAKYLDYAGLLHLWTRIKTHVTNKINELDVDPFDIATESADGVVTIYQKLAEVDGKIVGGTGITGQTSIVLNKVATSGKAEDVSVVGGTGFTGATNVQEALEIIGESADGSVKGVTGDGEWLIAARSGNDITISHVGPTGVSASADVGSTEGSADWGNAVITDVKIDAHGHVYDVVTGTLPSNPVLDLDSSVAASSNVKVLTGVTQENGELTNKTETEIVGGNKLTVTGGTDTITIDHDATTVNTNSSSVDFGGTFAVYTENDEYGHVINKTTFTIPKNPVKGSTGAIDGVVNELAVYDSTGTVVTSGYSINSTSIGQTGATNTLPTSKVVKDAIDAALRGGVEYKGVVDSTHPLPTEGYSQGDLYVVKDAGTYAGKACEVGDWLLANKDYVSGASATDDWDAVTGENQVTLVLNHKLRFGSDVNIVNVDGTDIPVILPPLAEGLAQYAVDDANHPNALHLKTSTTSEIGGGKVGATGSTESIVRPTETGLKSGESSHIASHYVDINNSDQFYVDIYGLTFAEIDAACPLLD